MGYARRPDHEGLWQVSAISAGRRVLTGELFYGPDSIVDFVEAEDLLLERGRDEEPLLRERIVPAWEYSLNSARVRRA